MLKKKKAKNKKLERLPVIHLLKAQNGVLKKNPVLVIGTPLVDL